MKNTGWLYRRMIQSAALWSVMLSMVFITVLNSGCSLTGNDVEADTGEVVISMTDAEGDFLTYAVDVVSMKLIKANGTEVQSLAQATTVDFAQYVEVTEFLTAATVPIGQYNSAEITLDFTNAVITLQDANGDAVEGAAVDSEGNPLTVTTVAIELNGGSAFTVAPGIPAHFTIDFDLESSNEVVFGNTGATITVNPVLIADTQLSDPKPHRLRGLLGAVNETDAQFEVVLRPFIHHQNDSFGSLTAHTATTTTYEIDGVEYSGSAGLTALAALDNGTAVVALGSLDVINKQYNATEVLAGSSVPWGTKDILQGSVISREAGNLAVHGGVVLRTDGQYQFFESVQVLIDENTKVFKQGDLDTEHLISDISVGQRVMILGVPGISINNEYVMDATEGTVRMKYSQVTGLINTVSPLTLDTQRINGRRVVIYDFTGTGAEQATDADPANYEINTGSLPLDQMAIADPVKVRGFPQAFGQAPEDFVASTLIDVTEVVSHLMIGYTRAGSDMAITSADADGIQMSLDGAGMAHYLERAGVIVDLNSLDSVPYIQPKEDNAGIFVLIRQGNVSIYSDYNEYQQALNDELTNGFKVRGINVFGQYDSNTNFVTANRIGIQLIEPAVVL